MRTKFQLKITGTISTHAEEEEQTNNHQTQCQAVHSLKQKYKIDCESSKHFSQTWREASEEQQEQLVNGLNRRQQY